MKTIELFFLKKRTLAKKLTRINNKGYKKYKLKYSKNNPKLSLRKLIKGEI